MREYKVVRGKYSTLQGDTWDGIAYGVYGDENYMGFLMDNNREHIETLVFSADVLLSVPALPPEIDDDLPEWRR